MHFLHFLSPLPLVSVALASGLTLPADAREGFGIQLWSDDGSQLYIHESQFEQYNITIQPGVPDPLPSGIAIAPTATATVGSLVRRGSPITCLRGTEVFVPELHDGLIYFADNLGCGTTYNSNRFASYKNVALIRWQGSTVLYTCNYSGADRVWSGPSLVSIIEQVFNYCNQQGVAAWYYDSYRQVSWGYTNRANGYCGPAQ
ncbi:hypothetical protein NQ176_g3815 [Zarea fungicola]|uniref:Uncharacterized protein n=1 Tax=Zarea fungicola TaxID=93591 RepID=A0ACC1NIU1_9HYPO|nr:hypothetical protein NQ176_g3815 [Lecanicillium fungicola]